MGEREVEEIGVTLFDNFSPLSMKHNSLVLYIAPTLPSDEDVKFIAVAFYVPREWHLTIGFFFITVETLLGDRKQEGSASPEKSLG